MGARFNEKMWTPDGLYALALDGEGKQAASVASNSGQALWGGIATVGYKLWELWQQHRARAPVPHFHRLR